MQMKITPRFSVREIIDSTIGKDWFRFQAEAMALGQSLHAYMQSFINSNRKRQGGSGNLAKSINFDKKAGAGLGRIWWGIGHIPTLQSRAPYWYVVNYGKTVSGRPYIPNYGNFVPGRFSGGDGRPQASMRGKGVESFRYAPDSGMGMNPRSPIRPMNFIQSTRHKLNIDLRAILDRLRRSK